ncbi:hypothetical protein GBAR_LOCUS6926 [Geodia barretti]|uniref:Uncharacterized protein n=1 Tax=Geodia barretti TaxID=519541 RepID=A0AA35WDF1_GEOBA|nr:hypothetical protein GBAR_LOCUS6926 [Geodia barretti]
MIHCLELTELLLAPRAKISLVHRFSNEPDLDEAVKKIAENHVYICVVNSDSSIQVHLTAERCLFGKAKSPINVIVSLIGAYFAFNIAYPKALYQLCIFIQHFFIKNCRQAKGTRNS